MRPAIVVAAIASVIAFANAAHAQNFGRETIRIKSAAEIIERGNTAVAIEVVYCTAEDDLERAAAQATRVAYSIAGAAEKIPELGRGEVSEVRTRSISMALAQSQDFKFADPAIMISAGGRNEAERSIAVELLGQRAGFEFDRIVENSTPRGNVVFFLCRDLNASTQASSPFTAQPSFVNFVLGSPDDYLLVEKARANLSRTLRNLEVARVSVDDDVNSFAKPRVTYFNAGDVFLANEVAIVMSQSTGADFQVVLDDPGQMRRGIEVAMPGYSNQQHLYQ
jgi:hypothetical protein